MKPADSDNTIKSLMFLLESKGKGLILAKNCLTREIDAAVDASDIFRSDSFGTKMFAAYSKLIGIQYLHQTLSKFVVEMCAIYGDQEISQGSFSSMSLNSLEVDPMKMSQDEDEILNSFTLMAYTQKILLIIIRSVKDTPLQMRLLCNHLRGAANTKFPGTGNRAVRSYMFSRFYCPAIVAPHIYGLTRDPPSSRSQRILVLISKALQNLANDSFFKESYMKNLNEFIEKNTTTIDSFSEDISKIVSNASPITVEVEAKTVDQSLMQIFSLINKFPESILNTLEAKGFHLQRMRLEDILKLAKTRSIDF